jgi:hypothetical protein
MKRVPASLRRAFLKEAKRHPAWPNLSPGARHVFRYEARLMARDGELWMGVRRREKLIAPLTGGRTSRSGHISRPSLLKYERELEKSGLLYRRVSSGKRLASGLRLPGVKVLVLDREVWRRAWAHHKYAGGSGRTFYRARAADNANKKVSESSRRHLSDIARPVTRPTGAPIW